MQTKFAYGCSIEREENALPRNRSVKAGGGQLTRVYTDALQGFVFDVAPDKIRRLKDGDPKSLIASKTRS